MNAPAPDATPSADAALLHVRVLCFSVLRERLGAAELDVTLPAPATGADLIAHLAAQHPPVDDYRAVVRLAVNEAYVPVDTPLQEGDEVALITPVSGG